MLVLSNIQRLEKVYFIRLKPFVLRGLNADILRLSFLMSMLKLSFSHRTFAYLVAVPKLLLNQGLILLLNPVLDVAICVPRIIIGLFVTMRVAYIRLGGTYASCSCTDIVGARSFELNGLVHHVLLFLLVYNLTIVVRVHVAHAVETATFLLRLTCVVESAHHLFLRGHTYCIPRLILRG